MRENGSIQLNRAFFYAIIIRQGFATLILHFIVNGGGSNGKLGFDCFDSYDRVVLDF